VVPGAIYPESLSTPERPRWSGYAHVQYVTNPTYLCNSVMILEALDRHATMADKIMMYPETWDVNGPENTSGLLRKARDEYQTKLVPIEVQSSSIAGDPTWKDSYTKILAFNQTQYRRVISLDSDATLLQVR
jgi:alpha-N-acetylglucosamine transferase